MGEMVDPVLDIRKRELRIGERIIPLYPLVESDFVALQTNAATKDVLGFPRYYREWGDGFVEFWPKPDASVRIIA